MDTKKAFTKFKTEGLIIGRLLVGYADLVGGSGTLVEK